MTLCFLGTHLDALLHRTFTITCRDVGDEEVMSGKLAEARCVVGSRQRKLR